MSSLSRRVTRRAGPGGLSIVDRSSSEPALSAAGAVELLAGDRDPVRVALVVDQVRSRRERRALLRHLGAVGPRGVA